MKRCPTCGLSLDDSQTFCTNDGTPLVAEEQSYDPQATMIIPPGSVPTVPPPSPPPQAQQTGWQTPARPTSPPVPAYASQQPLGYSQPGGTQSAQQPGKFGPALIGGAVTGILSLFAGFMPPNAFVIFSFFCIVWALIGGAVASMLYIKRAPNPVRTGEGAVIGLIAGAIGALIYLALDTTVAYAIHGDYIQMVANQQPEKISAGAFFALSGLAGAFTITGFSVLGGLIGVSMFEKRRGIHASMPPPPPPGYGQPPGGGYR
jgi:hypothetical protein